MSEFICVAHRGASGRWPENTLLAFQQALQAGARWLELDVQLSADGELVVIHDESLERTSDGAGLVAEQTFEQLRQLDVGRGQKVPLLAEVLDLAAGKATVNIELKGEGTGEPVAKLLLQRLVAGKQPLDQILASSLYENELRCFAKSAPQVPLALVADVVEPRIWQLVTELNLWSLHLEKSSIDKSLLAVADDRDIRLLAYTVNDPRELRRLKDLGVAGVFTDFPELFNRF